MTQPQTWCAAIFLALAFLRPGVHSSCQQQTIGISEHCPQMHPPPWYAGLGQLTPAAAGSVSDVVQGLLSSPVIASSGPPLAPVNGSSPEYVAPAPAVMVVRFPTYSFYPLPFWSCCTGTSKSLMIRRAQAVASHAATCLSPCKEALCQLTQTLS